MSECITSVDAGNGGTNAVLAQPGKGHKSVYFPSVRAAATGDSLGLGKDMELQYTYADWGGFRYIVGDDVLRVTRRHLERHHGEFRYGDEFHQFLVAYALAQLGVKEGTVDLTLFAPPGVYVEAKKRMQALFMERDGRVGIQLKGDKKPRVWRYENVTVWPEGIGAGACFVIDEDGEVINTDVLAGDVVILDSGVYTLDALKMVDGNFNPEALEHATWKNGGLGVHVLEPIVRTLKKQHDDFINVSVDDVDAAIRQGQKSKSYVIRAGGVEADIGPLIDKYSERFAAWLANNIVDGVFDGFRGIKSVILVGGGTTLTEKWLRQWYGDKILTPKKFDSTKKIHPVDMNAVGGLRFALMRQKQTS